MRDLPDLTPDRGDLDPIEVADLEQIRRGSTAGQFAAGRRLRRRAVDRARAGRGHAVDISGLSEVIGPGVASECVETKDGLHVWEDHFCPEVVDPETGEVLPDGEYGELVFTSLTKQAMPVVRYRTRDLTRLLPGTARTMRRIEQITGRSDDMLLLRGVSVFPTQIEELLLSGGANRRRRVRPARRPARRRGARRRGGTTR